MKTMHRAFSFLLVAALVGCNSSSGLLEPTPPPDLAPADGAGACTPGARDCSNGYALLCDGDDQWQATPCPNGATCSQGQCSCPGSLPQLCGAVCTSTASDVNNCGMCGNACPQPPNATPGCSNAVCGIAACNAGFADCNHDPKDGCEANLQADPMNCGACSTACVVPNAVPGCAAGKCTVAMCNMGFADCDKMIANGCELDTQTDPNNCGGCGAACMLPNATPGCTGGRCIVKACAMNFGDCDMNPVNGCEANLLTDAKNCGGCGNACDGKEVCRNSGCTCRACDIPNARTRCAVNMMVCLFDQCLPGFGDCNSNIVDGCEADLTSDNDNCGRCGNVCMGGKMCRLGACS